MARRVPLTSPLLTVKDLCNHLKVDTQAVYRLISAGKLPAFKVAVTIVSAAKTLNRACQAQLRFQQ
jgi:hypothetical protein